MQQENNLPQFTIKQLLEAGVHFGHKTMRRNPKISKYIYGARNGLSIIDLQQTADLFRNALKIVREIAKNNGRILFVATKKQASDVVAQAAKRCGQYYVNHRWLGGMLTNWQTISKSIKTLKQVEEQLANDELGLNKKEKLMLDRKRLKLEMSLGGIKTMGGSPDLIFVIDTNREALAVAEAKKLGVAIMAIVDSNCNPDGITFPIPGNDDSVKAIKLYCHLLSDAILSGIKENMSNAGIDLEKLDSSSVEEVLESIEKSAEEKSMAGQKQDNERSKKLVKRHPKKVFVKDGADNKEGKRTSIKKMRPARPSMKKSSDKKSD